MVKSKLERDALSDYKYKRGRLHQRRGKTKESQINILDSFVLPLFNKVYLCQ